MRHFYDIRCLDRNVAIRAIFLLWRRAAWVELADMGLGREIDEPFHDAADYIPGYRLRNDTHTETFLAALPFGVQERVILGADILIRAYKTIYASELAADEYQRRKR